MTLLRSSVFAFAVGSALTLASATASADGGTRADRPFTWSGFYIGAHAGSIQEDFGWAFNPPIMTAPNQVFSLDQSTGIYGLHIGVQHQFGQFVLGAEASFTDKLDDDFAFHVKFGKGDGFAVAKVDNFWTVGARLGWAPSSQWMVYGSGGYARGQVTSGQTTTEGAFASDIGATEDHNGWYAGGGIDYALTRNIILGIEYQHISLGTVNHCPRNICRPFDANRRDIDVESDLVRARLSIKFGDRDEPRSMK